MDGTVFSISICDQHPAIQYAAEELARCLSAGGMTARVAETGGFRLGLTSRFPELGAARGDADEITVETDGKGGVLSGSNPRSVRMTD